MIRLGINFHYPAINKTLVTAVFDTVCKLHFLVCKLCHGHVITIKIYEWFPKMMFYTWCKFQVYSTSETEQIEGGLSHSTTVLYNSDVTTFSWFWHIYLDIKMLCFKVDYLKNEKRYLHAVFFIWLDIISPLTYQKIIFDDTIPLSNMI